MIRPTVRWRALIGSDPGFTDASVTESDRILDEYIKRLNSLTGSKDNATFGNAIRDVCLAFNELGGWYGRHPELIDSWEREELIDFIVEAAQNAGFCLDENDDNPTDEWREW